MTHSGQLWLRLALSCAVLLGAMTPQAIRADDGCAAATTAIPGGIKLDLQFAGTNSTNLCIRNGNTSQMATCTPVGAVQLLPGRAIFNGGYLTCMLDPEQAGIGQFRAMHAEILAQTRARGTQSLFWHASLNMQMSQTGIGRTGTTQVRFGNQLLQYTQPVRNSRAQLHWAHVACTDDACRAQVGVDGNVKSWPLEGTVDFNRDALPITIGFNPETGARFLGTISYLSITLDDPIEPVLVWPAPAQPISNPDTNACVSAPETIEARDAFCRLSSVPCCPVSN